MPCTTTTIDRDRRNGLYELIRNHIAGLGDVRVAMEQDGDFATAERLGLEFAEDVRLLQDIGWHPRDERETFELTMPVDDLMEALKRLHDEAERVLNDRPLSAARARKTKRSTGAFRSA